MMPPCFREDYESVVRENTGYSLMLNEDQIREERDLMDYQEWFNEENTYENQSR